MTIPNNNGTSLLKPAETAACPIPGYVNTCSTRTAPPNSSLKLKNCSVIAGKRTFLIPCLLISDHPCSPLAFANKK